MHEDGRNVREERVKLLASLPRSRFGLVSLPSAGCRQWALSVHFLNLNVFMLASNTESNF